MTAADISVYSRFSFIPRVQCMCVISSADGFSSSLPQCIAVRIAGCVKCVELSECHACFDFLLRHSLP